MSAPDHPVRHARRSAHLVSVDGRGGAAGDAARHGRHGVGRPGNCLSFQPDPARDPVGEHCRICPDRPGSRRPLHGLVASPAMMTACSSRSLSMTMRSASMPGPIVPLLERPRIRAGVREHSREASGIDLPNFLIAFLNACSWVSALPDRMPSEILRIPLSAVTSTGSPGMGPS